MYLPCYFGNDAEIRLSIGLCDGSGAEFNYKNGL